MKSLYLGLFGFTVKKLILMRHAKSDWHNGADSDFDRPLNKRGRRSAAEVGALLKKGVKPPDLVISSPALRARQTVERVFLQTGWRLDRLRFDESVYLASAARLLDLCEAESQCESLMLVGHNPGLEDLLLMLCGDEVQRTKKGKVFTTANIAIIEFEPQGALSQDNARLVELIRPR
jgi:phosphohistidine phosphatase